MSASRKIAGIVNLCALSALLILHGSGLWAASAHDVQVRRQVTIQHSQFMLDGRPLQIISGEMHYARIPRAYWRDRLKKARAMGLNTISTYVFWNIHELRPGVYDFDGERDVAAFVRAAQEEGLYVILRPGPYVCAEWDLGGFPAWLLADSNMVLRSTDEQFMRAARRWLSRLSKELSPLQITRGGPIIAVQVENEYGSFDVDKQYLEQVRQAIVDAGLGETLLYTADGGDQLPAGALPGIPAAVNFGPGAARSEFEKLAKFRPGQPMMSGEYWAGWFDQWGVKHQSTDSAQQTQELDWMLQQGYSVNLYMFHGGTTFGFMNGAENENHAFLPDTTSYDYDAALDEAGRPTRKFYAFRDVILKHRPGIALPQVPAQAPVIEVPEFVLNETAPLWTNLGKPVRSDVPQSMEAFGQSRGYILYRTRIKGPVSGELQITELRDYSVIYVNGQQAGSLDRRLKQDHLKVNIPPGESQIDILVENSGRINFTKAMRDERKGITRNVSIAGQNLKGWEVFPLPMGDISKIDFKRRISGSPGFSRGYFQVEHTGDTYLDMRNWGKGSVWVNGHNLGHFWNIGPQQTLYVPAPWLKQGTNEVVVFAFEIPGSRTLRGTREPVLDEVRSATVEKRD